jgi:hypothetical protein
VTRLILLDVVLGAHLDDAAVAEGRPDRRARPPSWPSIRSAGSASGPSSQGWSPVIAGGSSPSTGIPQRAWPADATPGLGTHLRVEGAIEPFASFVFAFLDVPALIRGAGAV